MANLIELAKENAAELLREAYAVCAEEGVLPEGAVLSGTVEIPKDVQNGDFAANHAMTGARALRMPPRKIAEALAAHCLLDGSFFSSVEVAGPGFINFRLSENWYRAVLDAVRDEGAEYGHISDGAGKKVMVEFVSANPTGPMHLGNARGGVLGDALASVLSFAGWDVSREFYVNDAGNQIEKFASSIDARYQELLLGEKAPAFPEDGYHGDDIIALAKDFLAEQGNAWLQKPEAERHAAMAEFGLNRNIPRMKADLRRYGIEYDRWFLESELHESGFVKDTVGRLTELGYTYERMPGDVDGDGSIGISDVTTLIDMMLGTATGITVNADLNNDGSISISDLTALIDMLLNGE